MSIVRDYIPSQPPCITAWRFFFFVPFTTTAEVPTDNEQVNSPSAVRKYLDDGHLMIDANSHIFNTQGKMIK